MKKTIIISVLAIYTALSLSIFAAASKAETKKINILATTFPIYQLVRNITQDCAKVKVELMLPGQLGCPHDYMIRPQDMQKLAKADVLVINGLGMEDFLGTFVEKANPKLIIIDSSAGIKDVLEYSEYNLSKTGETKHEHGNGHKHEHRDSRHNNSVNPHLFASPRMSAKLAINIAAELSKIDPADSSSYLIRAQTYAKTMNRLADAMAELGKNLKNKRIVQSHDIFDYLARDIGLEIVGVIRAHHQKPSASEMMQLVKIIRKKKAGAIITEPQYSGQIAQTLSRETGVPLIKLDPAATGSDNAPLNYYETVMRQNIKILKNCPKFQ